jgi:hypothetical protein
MLKAEKQPTFTAIALRPSCDLENAAGAFDPLDADETFPETLPDPAVCLMTDSGFGFRACAFSL